MIVECPEQTERTIIDSFLEAVKQHGVYEVPFRPDHGVRLFTLPSGIKTSDLPALPDSFVAKETSSDAQLSSREFRGNDASIRVGDDVIFDQNHTVLIAGPCAVENRDQIMRIAEHLVETHKIKLFRAGSYKPRTSPYSFQGLGAEGLRLLDDVRSAFGVKIITEVKDDSHVAEVADVADIIQVGTKAMYNPALLRTCGQSEKPVMLKRGFMATIQEFLQAADFIMQQGNLNVILCERGLRNFEPETRFSLDLCGAAIMRERSYLPLVLDPSHAMGKRSAVPMLMRACAGFGCEGIMVETHMNPDQSWSDASQALHFEQLAEVYPSVQQICTATGRTLM